MKITKILSLLIAQITGGVVSVFAKRRLLIKKNKNKGNNQIHPTIAGLLTPAAQITQEFSKIHLVYGERNMP